MSQSRVKSRNGERKKIKEKNNDKNLNQSNLNNESIDEEFLRENNLKESDEFLEKWSGPLILGPTMIAIFSLVIIFTGQIILSSDLGTCGYDLQSFISGMIAVSYIFLFIFSWIYIGQPYYLKIQFLGVNFLLLKPFKSLKMILFYYVIVGIICFILMIYGTILLQMSVFCKKTAPILYNYTLFLLFISWMSFVVIFIYAIKLYFGKTISNFVKESTRSETLDEIENRIFLKKFNEYDLNSEGVVTREEMKKILESIAIYIPDEEIKSLADTFDPDNTGMIPFDPFYAWFKEMNKEAEYKENEDD